MKRLFYFLTILGALFLSSCSKPKKINNNNGNTNISPNDPGSTLDKIKDSVFLYAKEDYYWYNSLPDYATFKPRTSTGADDKTALDNEVNKLSQIAINPATGLPYEYFDSSGEAKYSFIDNGQVSGEL